MICWRSTGKTPVIELAEFRKRLGVLDDEYTRSDNFKRWIIENPIKQINEHTDIIASYEQHKKGRTITGFSFKFKQKKKTEAETPKNSDSSPHIKKPSQIPTNIVKQPENANMDVLEHRKSKITGAIMANGLADRFKRGDESVMDMMKRIKEEITTDATADQWENKLEEFGVVFSHDEIPEGRTLPLSSMGAFFALQKVKRQSKFTLPFFCFSKKGLASVYERHNESSIISPSEKPLFVSDFKKILTIVRFCF